MYRWRHNQIGDKKMNKARIIRDKNKDVYLCVQIDEQDIIFFKIEPFTTEPEGKKIGLSDSFNIDLSGKK